MEAAWAGAREKTVVLAPRERRRRRAGRVAVLLTLVAGLAGCDRSDPDSEIVPVTTAPPPPTTATTTAPTSTTAPPVSGVLRVEGDLVRGAPATAVATGLPPGRRLTLVLSDAGQRVPLQDVTPAADGSARIEFRVPEVGMHEGICVDDGPCEYRPVGLGIHQLSLADSPYDLGGALAVDVELVSARRNVAYPVRVRGECGPVRTELDGRAWIADDPARFVGRGDAEAVDGTGTLTITGATTARFQGDDGTTGRFTAGPRHFC